MKDVNQIWKELQKYAEPLLPPQTVDIWLKACVPTHMDGDKLVVEALPFVVKKIREEHLATLEKVMVEHGLGISMMTELTLKGRAERVLTLPAEPAASRELGLAVRSLGDAPDILKRFIACTQRIVRELSE